MGAPTLARLAAPIPIATRRIEVGELSFRLFKGEQPGYGGAISREGGRFAADSPLEEGVSCELVLV
jgi:hypothetical protein